MTHAPYVPPTTHTHTYTHSLLIRIWSEKWEPLKVFNKKISFRELKAYKVVGKVEEAKVTERHHSLLRSLEL